VTLEELIVRKLRVILIFAAAGLVGPLIWLAAWPPARLADVLPRPVWFFYTDLVEILWPASMMGPWIGVPLNLLLFTVLGLAVAWVAQTRSRLAISYAVVTILIFFMALCQAGFAVLRLDVLALVVALLLYAIPFWIVMRSSTVPRSV
jgi:hypothetical protein